LDIAKGVLDPLNGILPRVFLIRLAGGAWLILAVELMFQAGLV
jgi:hypothetical protein